MLLHSKGDLNAAEPLFRQAGEIRRNRLGEEHPLYATDLNNLALLLQDKGDLDGAEPLYRQAIAIAEKSLGPEHSNTKGIKVSLVALLAEKRSRGQNG